MKVLHRDGQIATQPKDSEKWYPHNCVLIEDDEEAEQFYEVELCGKEGRTGDDTFIKSVRFEKEPTTGEIMYCLKTVEREYFGSYYGFTAVVNKAYKIKDTF
jgi:hypothetical protein